MEIKFYTLSDPRSPNIIRYIGKTSQKLARRLDQHISTTKRANGEKGSRNHNTNWITSLLNVGLKPLIIEIDTFECDKSSKEWQIVEKYWISQCKSWGFELTNLTDGGDGNQNQVFSEESLRKKSEKLKGIPRPKEVRERISKSHLGKEKSATHIENVREAIIQKQGRPVNQYSLDGEFIREWRCIAEAADFYKVDRTSLGRCCKGKFKKSAGFVWKYKNEDIV